MIKKGIFLLDPFKAYIANGISFISFFSFLLETETFAIERSLDNEKDNLQKPEKFKAVM